MDKILQINSIDQHLFDVAGRFNFPRDVKLISMEWRRELIFGTRLIKLHVDI